MHTLVALKKVAANYRKLGAGASRADGEALVLSRRCSDGGWNCGNPNVLNFDLPSYPETTALALLGLQGRSPAELAGPLSVARAVSAPRPDRRWRRPGCDRAALSWRRIRNRPAGTARPPTDVMLAALEALGHPDGNYRLLRTGGRA